MKRSERMEPVVRTMEGREQEAVRLLGEARRRLAAEQKQLADLHGYREEYRGRMQSEGQMGIPSERLQEFLRFMSRLDQAIDAQRQQVEYAAVQCRQREAAWLAARGKSEAVGKVMARLVAEEQYLLSRREQKESDEFALRRYRSGRSGSDGEDEK